MRQLALSALKLDEPKVVGGGKTKQDVTIADVNTSVILTTWEGDVGKLQSGQLYKFNRLVVRTFRRKVSLSLPPSGASIEPISDIGNVVEDSIEMDVNLDMLLEAKVIGVYQLETIYTCFNCKKGKVTAKTSKYGSCDICGTTQNLQKRKITAKLFLEGSDTTTHVTVRAYEDMLRAITEGERITSENLLSARLFQCNIQRVPCTNRSWKTVVCEL